MAGIYIHIPFCSQYCTYCNFYSVKQTGWQDRFVEAVGLEAVRQKSFFNDKPGSSVSTVYIGGGTPSILSAVQLGKIIGSIKTAFDLLSGVEEFTIEVNPNDITLEYALTLKDLGINRVSMGVQSFADRHLKWMNRRHSAAEGEAAYRILRDAGFENISLDLIFGFELLSDKEWIYNLDSIVSLYPEHISAYQMSIEGGSALAALVRRGQYKLPGQEQCFGQYLILQEKLAAAGYEQYEISNFARKAVRGESGEIYRSRHNSAYWEKVPYLGLGPAAHSFTGMMEKNGVQTARRFWNNPGVKRYCDYFSGICPSAVIGGEEELAPVDIFNETLMLGLRKTKGFSLKELDSFLLAGILPEIEKQVRAGNLVMEQDYIKIPSGKLFISDGIIRDLFI